MKIHYLLAICSLFFGCTGSISLSELDALENSLIPHDVLIEDIEQLPITEPNKEDVFIEPEMDVEKTPEPTAPSYPPGPYDIDTFKVMPDMTFYGPWNSSWVSLGEFYKSEDHKALLIVSSAGWCGPCLMEAAALVDLYDKYHHDGLEILYTMGNTQVPGDVPFDEGSSKESDMEFMEIWEAMVANEAQAVPNYKFYADPLREFLPYLPNHPWPLSVLITTKDMGIRLVEVGYWSALMENKIMLVLYNDVPSIPFN